MKAKKLFAILASLCMLLALVPTMAVAAEVELPAPIEGAPNYADLSTAEAYQNNTAPLPVVDTAAGTIVLGATANGTSRAEFDLGSLTATDDYVISFKAGTIANWHSTTWGLQVAMTANNGSISGNQSFIFAGTSKHTFTDANGTSAASFSKKMDGTFKFDILVDADAAAGTRTYHVFVGGAWVYSSAAQPAIEPQLAFVGSRGGSNSFTISELNVYKVGEEAPRYLPTMPAGNQNLAALDSTMIGGTNVTAANFDKTTGALPTVGLTDKQVVLTVTPSTPWVSNEYVVSGNILFRNGWNGSIGALTVGTGAVLTADKATDTSGTVYINGVDSGYAPDSRTPLTSGDGANFAAHVYPNDAGTSDVDFYFENTFVGTVTGITPNKIVQIGTSKVQWTDSITISNVKMYNVKADPDVRDLPTTGAAVIGGADLELGHSKDGNPATYDAATDTVTLTGSGNGESFARADLTVLNGADYVVTFKHAGMGYGTSWNMRVNFGGTARLNLYNSALGVVYTDADGNATTLGGDIRNNTSVYSIWFEANADGTYNYIFFDDGVWTATVKNQPAPTAIKFDQQGSHEGYAPKFSNFSVCQVGASTVANITVNNVEGGTATGSGLVQLGAQATITATAADGYTFAGWLKDGGAEYVSTDAVYTFTVEGDATYTPVFTKAYTVAIGWTSVPYTISGVPGVDAETVFKAANSFAVPEGATVTITMILDDSKVAHFKNGNSGWSTLQLNNPVYTIGGVAADWNVILQPDTKPYVTFEIEGEGALDQEDGYLFGGEKVTATPAEGWEFSHFEVTINGGDMVEYTANPLENPSRNGQTATIKAVFKELPGYIVTVPSAVGGKTTITGDTNEYDRYDYGTVVTLKATAETGYDFAYWIIGNRTYTTKTVYWTVNANVTATPVFRSRTANEYVVTFYSIDGRLIDTLTSTEIEGGAALPTVPYRYGYTGGNWDFEAADGISSDMNVYPTYVKDSTTYTVTVTGGTVNKSTVEYETRVTLVATATDFAAWVDESGAVVSTDRIYSFLVTRNIALKVSAQAADYAVAINPTSLNTSTGDTTFTMSLVAQTMFSNDYRLIECGFVYTTNAATADSLKIGNSGVKQKVSTKTTEGQFVYTLKNAPKSATITARAYMVIEKDGVQTTVYSGLCDASWK